MATIEQQSPVNDQQINNNSQPQISNNNSQNSQQQQDQQQQQAQIDYPFIVRFLVHKSAIGPLIGANGVNIQGICQNSGAAVSVEPYNSNYEALLQVIKERIVVVRFHTVPQLLQAVALMLPVVRKAREVALVSFGKPAPPPEEYILKALIHITPVQTLLANSGELIKQMQSETGVNIKVLSRLPLCSESPLLFKANDLQSLLRAVEQSVPYFSRAGDVFRPYRLTAPCNSPIESRSLRIPAYAVGFVIGRQGSRVKYITQQTSCYVTLDREFADYNPRYGKEAKAQLFIKGPVMNHKIAIDMIFQAIHIAADQMQRNNPNGNADGQNFQQPQQYNNGMRYNNYNSNVPETAAAQQQAMLNAPAYQPQYQPQAYLAPAAIGLPQQAQPIQIPITQ